MVSFEKSVVIQYCMSKESCCSNYSGRRFSPVSGLGDFPHPALVALVEKPVRLVDDEIPQVLQSEPGCLCEVVQQSSGRGHDYVHLENGSLVDTVEDEYKK